MKHNRSRMIVAACVLPVLLASGTVCGESQSHNELARPSWVPKYARWPELDILADVPGEIDTPRLAWFLKVRRSDNKQARHEGYCKFLSDKRFQANLKSFADTPIPDKYASQERQQHKLQLVEAITQLQELCRKNAATEAMDQKVDRIGDLWKRIIEIPSPMPPDEQEAPAHDRVHTNSQAILIIISFSAPLVLFGVLWLLDQARAKQRGRMTGVEASSRNSGDV